MRKLGSILILLAVMAAVAAPVARAENVPIQGFYGEFEGRTLFPMGEQRNRDLFVRIQALGRFGFSVEWRTTITKSSKTSALRDQILEFTPTSRPSVYLGVFTSSEEPPPPATDESRVSGPVDGVPYAWARIAERTLTINVLTIEDTGDYVMQIYNRTLTDTGMTLEFMRVRNGHIEQNIKGNLTRIGG